MKNLHLLILIFVTICYNNFAVAQYQSVFGNSQTFWNVKTDQLFGPVNDSIVYISDTTISSIIYKKVKYYRETSELETYLIKEDTLLGKLSYRKIDDTTHYQVYDLSLSLGNSFNGYIVDSIYFSNGKKHLRLNYTPAWTSGEKFVMIEGVGTNIGLMYHNGMAGVLGPYLLCHYKDNIPNFINSHPIYNGLCHVVGIDEVIIKPQINIYPNPSNSELTVEFTNSFSNNLTIEIYDINGKLELMKELNQLNKITINTHDLPAGVYFITLKENHKIIVTQKWIKTE